MDEIVEAWAVWMGYYKYHPNPNVPYPWKVHIQKEDESKIDYTLESDKGIVYRMNQYMQNL